MRDHVKYLYDKQYRGEPLSTSDRMLLLRLRIESTLRDGFIRLRARLRGEYPSRYKPPLYPNAPGSDRPGAFLIRDSNTGKVIATRHFGQRVPLSDEELTR